MHSPQSVQHLGSNVKLIEDDSDQFKLLILMVHELSTGLSQRIRTNNILLINLTFWMKADEISIIYKSINLRTAVA
ncbi:hypothetical protein DERF_008560 [Dermatophagoides farinae]|uniref:Uncharacterized protein n=1 Tax=Dermatophagoides farinae TaxID=6954 RepID=A0A922L4W2_DERFA|nr:hypothetical protein DERF_008560 [Dermatophagoides farinae]